MDVVSANVAGLASGVLAFSNPLDDGREDILFVREKDDTLLVGLSGLTVLTLDAAAACSLVIEL